MLCLTNPAVETITVMKAIRVGATEGLINNFLAYIADVDPGPCLVVEPNDNLCKRYSTIQLDPMIRDTERLHGKIRDNSARDKSNKTLYKEFPGGFILIASARSPGDFRQLTVRYLLNDEVDGYPGSTGDEGDPIDLAVGRTRTVAYSKIVNISSPTIRGISRIAAAYEESSQGHYEVPCPHCGYFQILVFGPRSEFAKLSTGYLKFDKANCTYAHYECQNCRKPIDESEKHMMVARGRWRHLFPERVVHRGFHISELVAPWLKSSWTEIAKDWVKTEHKRGRLQVFINQRLGETWRLQDEVEIDPHFLMTRREEYERVPAGALLLIMSVDVQSDRLEALVKGWGLQEESWFVDYRIIYGSPENDSTWARLDEYADTTWQWETGVRRKIVAMGVDSGFKAEKVYRYVLHRRRQRRRMTFAFVGRAGFDRQMVALSKSKRLRTILQIAGIDTIKQKIFDRLQIVRNKSDDPFPPGYMHFNMKCVKEYFDQLTSERQAIGVNRKTGQTQRVWKLPEGARNEALDCEVYNHAALAMLEPVNWEKLAGVMAAEAERIKGEPVTIESPQPKPPSPRRPTRKRLRFRLK